MPDDLIINEEVSTILSQEDLLFDGVAYEKCTFLEDGSLLLRRPTKIIPNTSIELLQVILGV